VSTRGLSYPWILLLSPFVFNRNNACEHNISKLRNKGLVKDEQWTEFWSGFLEEQEPGVVDWAARGGVYVTFAPETL